MRLPLRGPRVLVGGALLASLLATACGPSVPVAVGIKDVPLDILVGREDTPAAPGAAPAIPSIVQFPQLLTGSSVVSYIDRYKQWTPPPLAASAPPVCPSLDPQTPSLAAADPEVSTTAPNGTWLFRQSGSAGSGTAYPVPSQAYRAIAGAAATGTGTWQFYEAAGDLFGLPAAEMQFTASNGGSGPATPLVSPTSEVGLGYLWLLTQDGHLILFNFSTPLKMLATPAQRNIPYNPDPNNPALPTVNGSWTSSASDARDGSNMTIQATNLGIVRDNVCGTPVNAWQVGATITITSTQQYSGAIPTPAQTNLTLSGTYDVATGLGGMIVAESLNCSGTLAGKPYTCNNFTATLASSHPVKR